MMIPPDLPWAFREIKSHPRREDEREDSNFFPTIMVSWKNRIEGE